MESAAQAHLQQQREGGIAPVKPVIAETLVLVTDGVEELPADVSPVLENGQVIPGRQPTRRAEHVVGQVQRRMAVKLVGQPPGEHVAIAEEQLRRQTTWDDPSGFLERPRVTTPALPSVLGGNGNSGG